MKRAYYVILSIACTVAGFGGYYAHQAQSREHSVKAAFEKNDGGFYQTPVAKDEMFYRVSPSELYPRSLEGSTIPPLNDPNITTVPDADNAFRDTFLGLDVESSGQHRFYPISLLWWHEVINDTFSGEHIAITFSPLSGSAAVYKRDDGENYSASSYVYNGTTVLKASTSDHLIDQLSGTVIAAGDAQAFAGVLVRKPFTLMTWGAWKEAYPYGSVVSFDTGFERDYAHSPYGKDYDTNDTMFFPVNHIDTRLALKDIVYGVQTDDGQVAFVQKNFIDGQETKVSASMSGVTGDLVGVMKDGVMHISFTGVDDVQNVAFVRAMAFAYFANYPAAKIVN